MKSRLVIGFLVALSLFVVFYSKVASADTIGANVLITPEGNVPSVSINCKVGHDYTLSLVHVEGGAVQYSYGAKQRILCSTGTITFDGFNLNLFLIDQIEPIWWRYVHTPIEYIIKDTTGLFQCDAGWCPLINLYGYDFDYSKYLASSTVYPTIVSGPVYQVDSETHTVWSNVGVVNPPILKGNSNVLFIPGVMGSKLYEEIDSADNELWVSKTDSKLARLALTTEGKSVNSVYTKDDTQSLNDEAETGIVDEVFGSNIYNSLINSLREWKTEGTINDYAFIPYDWRLSLNDIITNGTTTTGKLSYSNDQNFSDSFILNKLKELQTSSGSGKVTIIAHSNGGLVAKALVQKLKDTNNPLYNQIDKVILVAVPQVGTPDAMTALLHGSELGYGFIMHQDRSRQLSENMPTIYNLLPSASYFSVVDPSFAIDKVVSFENKPFFTSQLTQYGFFVSDSLELKNYILGSDGRIKPTFIDTVHPNIGNSVLYSQAQNMHQVLDSWQPASTTKVIQIAGWGEETLSGIEYKSYLDSNGKEQLSFKPKMVVDGDRVVVVPSALWMSTSTPNIERWWVDLAKFNGNDLLRTEHRNILEVSNVRSFIKSKIINNIYNNQDNIVVNNISTLISNKKRLHYTLHSPLTLGIVDFEGRYTGFDPITKEVREEIPDVMYKQIGDVQFLSVPSEIAHTIKLKGLDTGSFSLDVDNQIGNSSTVLTSFQGIPSSTTTIVTMNVPANSDFTNTTLEIDTNGDGSIDSSLKSKLNEVVLMPRYKWEGFAQPINDIKYHPEQKQSVFKTGSTVPVKFQIKNWNNVVVQASSTPKWLSIEKLSTLNSPVDEPVYTELATTGSEFKWDILSQQYIYNWSTKGLASGYWYKISVKLDDNTTYSVIVGLK